MNSTKKLIIPSPNLRGEKESRQRQEVIRQKNPKPSKPRSKAAHVSYQLSYASFKKLMD